jgi:hypothetical protein
MREKDEEMATLRGTEEQTRRELIETKVKEERERLLKEKESEINDLKDEYEQEKKRLEETKVRERKEKDC